MSYAIIDCRNATLAQLIELANHLLEEGFAAPLKRYRLSATDWRVLGTLGERNGIRSKELAELARFKQPTLTKALDRMEKAELVTRLTPAEDRRCCVVSLTGRGRSIARPLLARAREHEAAVSRRLGATATHALKVELRQLIDLVESAKREQRMRHGQAAPTIASPPSRGPRYAHPRGCRA